jgi:hypothetical protein
VYDRAATAGPEQHVGTEDAMSTTAILEGTLRSDGTLELDQKPNLPPGRVQVVLQPLPPPPATRGLVEVMDEIRQSQRARGYQGRTSEEMQAEEAARREEDEDYERRWEQLWGTPQPPGTGQE